MKRKPHHTTSQDPIFDWFAGFEPEKPDDSVHKQAMNRILQEWTQRPVIAQTAYTKEYWWLYGIGAITLILALFLPGPLGVHFQITMQGFEQIGQTTEKILQSSKLFDHPLLWLLISGGLFLYLADWLLSKKTTR